MAHLRIVLYSVYVVTPWRALYEWTIIAALAFMLAVGLVAILEPLYDIAKWEGLL